MLKLTSEIKRIRALLGLRDDANVYLIVILATLSGLFTLILPDRFFRAANLQSMAFVDHPSGEQQIGRHELGQPGSMLLFTG